MINKLAQIWVDALFFKNTNKPIEGAEYLYYLILNIFVCIVPMIMMPNNLGGLIIGLPLVISLTYRRLRTIGIVNKFLLVILSLLIVPILTFWIMFVYRTNFGLISMDSNFEIYLLLFLSLFAFSYLIFKKPKS